MLGLAECSSSRRSSQRTYLASSPSSAQRNCRGFLQDGDPFLTHDILGIPFDFAAKPVISPPAKPRETVRVHAVRPDRDHLEIVFPRVEGYRVELPEERLEATFGPDSVLELTPDLVGPSKTHNQGIIGEGVDLTLAHLEEMRSSTILFHLTKHRRVRKRRQASNRQGGGDECRAPRRAGK